MGGGGEGMYLNAYVGPWTDAEAAHLGRRAGFGGTPADVTRWKNMGMNSAVNLLVDYAGSDQTLEARILSLPQTADNNALRAPLNLADIQGYWLFRMANTTQPLQEQFALFLHDHFVSDYSKVRSGLSSKLDLGNDGSVPGQSCTGGALAPDSQRTLKTTARLLLEQLALFRTQGSGPYREMLRAITRDTAMLFYLDNRLNVKGKAQENYAREVMELFSMGVGNYSEEDVREIARAFTGETIQSGCINNWPYTYLYRPDQHDTNPKTVFGQSFNFAGYGDDANFVIDLILARVSGAPITPAHAVYPAVAIYMAWKLINWFVCETIPIDHPAVAELANYYGNTRVGGDYYNTREALRTLLKSNLFYLPEYRYAMYKHPADYMISALRLLGLTETNFTTSAANYLTQMGMPFYKAPNVAGWNHGKAWISSGSLIARYNYANYLSNPQRATNAWCDALLTAGGIANATDHTGMIEYFRARLIQTALRTEEQAALLNFLVAVEGSAGSATAKYYRKIRGLVHLFLTLPKFQLK